jgi:DNA (cytosine-5)-methyltransferase 1
LNRGNGSFNLPKFFCASFGGRTRHTLRPIGIDLFAGAGGLSLGFEQAGFDVACAVEIDPVHAAVHHFNFPHTAVLARSVIGLTGAEIRRAAAIGGRPVDVVFGGPPCQGFSLIGQRMLDDPRNELVKEFLRIVRELDARAFVFENVKGLTVGKHRAFLETLVDSFESSGYHIALPWKVLNACNYGVPQDRQRLFLIGTQKDLPRPIYPPVTSTDLRDLLLADGGRRTPTCGEALGDLPDVDQWESLLDADSTRVRLRATRSAYASELRGEGEGVWHYGYARQWDPGVLTSSARTAHSEISRRRFARTQPGSVEPISRFFKLAEDGICNTLRAGTDSARGAFTSPRPIHYRYPRCVTVREMARLHGYPDWFRFHVTKWHGARQIGNSVPPPLARAVAGAVMKALGAKPSRPAHALELGPETLLALDMGQASRHWGVPVPIGRRDKRSGQRKRRQWDIERSELENLRRAS